MTLIPDELKRPESHLHIKQHDNRMTHSNISQEEKSDALVFFQDSGIIEWNNKRPFPSTQTYDLL